MLYFDGRTGRVLDGNDPADSDAIQHGLAGRLRICELHEDVAESLKVKVREPSNERARVAENVPTAEAPKEEPKPKAKPKAKSKS